MNKGHIKTTEKTYCPFCGKTGVPAKRLAFNNFKIYFFNLWTIFYIGMMFVFGVIIAVNIIGIVAIAARGVFKLIWETVKYAWGF